MESIVISKEVPATELEIEISIERVTINGVNVEHEVGADNYGDLLIDISSEEVLGCFSNDELITYLAGQGCTLVEEE